MKKQFLISILFLSLVSFLQAEINETGVNVDFTYTLTGKTITLTDNSTITETDTLAVWDIFWQVKTGDTVRKVANRVQQPSDSVFSYTYAQSGNYTVTLIYQKWYLPSNGNPGYNGGQITKSVNISIDTFICVDPTFSITHTGNEYTFTNTTNLSLDSGLNVSYMWVLPSNNFTSTETEFTYTFTDVGAYPIYLWQLVSNGDTIVCNTYGVDTIHVTDLSTGINELEREDVKVYWNGYKLVVEPKEEIKQVYIYNLMGQLVDLNERQNDGVYVVYIKLHNGNTVSRKIFYTNTK